MYKLSLRSGYNLQSFTYGYISRIRVCETRMRNKFTFMGTRHCMYNIAIEVWPWWLAGGLRNRLSLACVWLRICHQKLQCRWGCAESHWWRELSRLLRYSLTPHRFGQKPQTKIEWTKQLGSSRRSACNCFIEQPLVVLGLGLGVGWVFGY